MCAILIDGVAVPVILYNNSCGSDNFVKLNGQSLMWKGNIYILYMFL